MGAVHHALDSGRDDDNIYKPLLISAMVPAQNLMIANIVSESAAVVPAAPIELLPIVMYITRHSCCCDYNTNTMHSSYSKRAQPSLYGSLYTAGRLPREAEKPLLLCTRISQSLGKAVDEQHCCITLMLRLESQLPCDVRRCRAGDDDCGHSGHRWNLNADVPGEVLFLGYNSPAAALQVARLGVKV